MLVLCCACTRNPDTHRPSSVLLWWGLKTVRCFLLWIFLLPCTRKAAGWCCGGGNVCHYGKESCWISSPCQSTTVQLFTQLRVGMHFTAEWPWAGHWPCFPLNFPFHNIFPQREAMAANRIISWKWEPAMWKDGGHFRHGKEESSKLCSDTCLLNFRSYYDPDLTCLSRWELGNFALKDSFQSAFRTHHESSVWPLHCASCIHTIETLLCSRMVWGYLVLWWHPMRITGSLLFLFILCLLLF